MTEPYFPLPVRAFSAVGFDSRKGQPLDSRASRGLRDMVSARVPPGFQVGPLFADDPHIAGTLFQGSASRVRS